jgi:gamma-glutamyltranspeptidase/glutathione hydrolase
VDQLLTGVQHARTIPHAVKPSGDTVAITATASDGTAVSLIQSLFHSFGSRLRDPRTGIVLHNRGSFFSSDPTSPNFLAPGRRPAHTLMPVLAEHSDGTTSALGTMGGRAQPQILTQLIRRSAGIGPSDAVAAPRFVLGGPEAGTRSEVAVAEADLSLRAIDDLRRAGFAVRMTHPHDEELGHAMIAMRAADGRVSAGADPRSDGSTYTRP